LHFSCVADADEDEVKDKDVNEIVVKDRDEDEGEDGMAMRETSLKTHKRRWLIVSYRDLHFGCTADARCVRMNISAYLNELAYLAIT